MKMTFDQIDKLEEQIGRLLSNLCKNVFPNYNEETDWVFSEIVDENEIFIKTLSDGATKDSAAADAIEVILKNSNLEYKRFDERKFFINPIKFLAVLKTIQ